MVRNLAIGNKLAIGCGAYIQNTDILFIFYFQNFIHLVWVFLLHWKDTESRPSSSLKTNELLINMISTSTHHPTKINQITTPRNFLHAITTTEKSSRNNKKKAAPKKSKKKLNRAIPSIVKEFTLQHLMNIGISSSKRHSAK